jgi:hypothetical protein
MLQDFTFQPGLDEKKAPRGRFLEWGVAELVRHMMGPRSMLLFMLAVAAPCIAAHYAHPRKHAAGRSGDMIYS